jgi:hypothetical protein
MKIETEQQRREFLQEVIDRLLYLQSEEREKFLLTMESTFKKFVPMYRIEHGATRVYHRLTKN